MPQIIIGLVAGLAIGGMAVFIAVRKITAKKIEDFIKELASSKETVRQFLSRWLSEREINDYLVQLKDNLSSRIYERIAEPTMSDNVAHLVVNRLADKLSEGDEKREPSNRGFLGHAMHLLGNAVKSRVEVAVENNQDTIEQILSGKINDAIRGNGKEVISTIIDNEIDTLLSQPVSSLFKENERMIASFKQRIMKF